MSNHDANTTHAPGKNIIETAAANGSFHTLGKALEAADLTQTLKESGPYTFFAPTDAAFKKLPEGTLENWLKPENKAELISVLKYHVMPGRVPAVGFAPHWRHSRPLQLSKGAPQRGEQIPRCARDDKMTFLIGCSRAARKFGYPISQI